jgi:hypothetical protein
VSDNRYVASPVVGIIGANEYVQELLDAPPVVVVVLVLEDVDVVDVGASMATLSSWRLLEDTMISRLLLLGSRAMAK